MAKNYGGKTYNEDWVPIDAMGNTLGEKDWAANAAYAAETQTQNPYTNEAGASAYDKSGLIPGNEPGSTLPKGPAPVLGGTRRASAAGAMPSFGMPSGVAPGGDDVWALNGSGPGWLPSAPIASKTTSRLSASKPAYVPPQQGPSEDGPRRISTGLIDPNTPFLFGEGESVGDEDALSALAKLLQGVLR